MSTNSVEVVVLCEDRQQEVFIRRFLQRRCGFNLHDFRPRISPSGRGSGEQWVREQFPRQLRAYRSQLGRRNTVLIVATDADTQEVSERLRSFELACQNENIPFRQANEQVIFVVPKRNIETWFAYLRGETVNEADPYRKYTTENDCRQDVARLDKMCRQQRLEHGVPASLQQACGEFVRIQP